LSGAAQEDARLVQLVSGYGAANWSVIAEVRDVRVCSAGTPAIDLLTGAPEQRGRKRNTCTTGPMRD
jgi:hypothetical protein